MGRRPKTDKKATIVTVKKNTDSSLQSKKLEAVKLAMEQITKTYGEGSIMRMGDSAANAKVEVVPTGILPLDIALGVGGLPRGRVTEIFGPEASGKTTLCLHVIKEAQKLGGTAAFIDAEHALDPARARTIGVDLNNMLISQPDSGEQALEIVETLVRSNAVDVIVVDSVAALVPKAEIEGEMGDSMMGVQARLMSQALRKLTGAISKSKAVVIFTNQLRQKIGVMFGNPETTPGGLALKFYASVRIDVRKIANIKTPSGDSIGSQHRARVIKNKVAPPFKQTEFDIMNTEGVSIYGGILDLAVLHELINKAGAFFKIDNETIGQGREASKQYLKDNPKVTDKLKEKIWEKVKALPIV
ncbi:recombinase RecA [Candidatus Shapirobacteria bacterium RIFOXYD1_FULL_38_32]|uniref:Protein RecA n=2 Tax=Candidatus Shapironibacteriota TaxID=1752721 RepID=A0A0G0JYG5_9BACT|nr:MAG: Protein RecA [Candidatus Shapirobacteria bacterium GW2011_GWE2_38_30]KKQ91219.1 MAG: Protein RecA [Candidatus Shapirobacteria bacterium GW2011_GWE1_38_92]OGL55892.1 MAG: recombinase RecA [Candidatus Shapirobacteria bacterium RIFOXYA1_FULL_39_17]OGL56845.1 MAG: recombinase RecA [Candidatus Shapirobacteria bacterium RIFOXYC1_FULL_38_24]OGL57139.1 MAG: recombinase RecA [Candidatus Shapirobacteria bacterium RIFOXYD1_FULL_38_32]HCU55444.1 recombinase RecA [Candidatus Shapirobacteria bacteri